MHAAKHLEGEEACLSVWLDKSSPNGTLLSLIDWWYIIRMH